MLNALKNILFYYILQFILFIYFNNLLSFGPSHIDHCQHENEACQSSPAQLDIDQRSRTIDHTSEPAELTVYVFALLTKFCQN